MCSNWYSYPREGALKLPGCKPECFTIEFSPEQISEFTENHTWAADLFDDDDENITMQAYITAYGVYYEIHKDRPDGSHVEIGADSTGLILRHTTTDSQNRPTRFVAAILPGEGKMVFNLAYDNAGNRILDEWIEYDSEGNMTDYWDILALEAEAQKTLEQSNTEP